VEWSAAPRDLDLESESGPRDPVPDGQRAYIRGQHLKDSGLGKVPSVGICKSPGMQCALAGLDVVLEWQIRLLQRSRMTGAIYSIRVDSFGAVA